MTEKQPSIVLVCAQLKKGVSVIKRGLANILWWHPSHSCKQFQGFTLIELSIVLVIVGLLVGGVLVGQDLIEGAKIRGQISQIEKFTTATHTLRLKYNCLPGDCKNAVALGLGSNAGLHDGDGNKQIDVRCSAYAAQNSNNFSKESHNFFMHLTNAGLVEGSFSGFGGEAHNEVFTLDDFAERFPAAEIKGLVYVTKFSTAGGCGGGSYTLREGGNGFVIGPNNLQGSDHFHGILSPNIAYSIDNKIDDGKTTTGGVGASVTNGGYNQHTQALGSTDACLPENYIPMPGYCGEDNIKLNFLNRF